MDCRFIIFLDVDGVLHPVKWVIPDLDPEIAKQKSPKDLELIALLCGYRSVPDGPCFSQLPLFECVMEPYLDQLGIVITSSWREDPQSYQLILDALSPNVRERVMGATGKGHRPDGIKVWLRQHTELNPLPIVIDDDQSWTWRKIRDSAVLLFPSEDHGFSEVDAAWLTYLLALSPGDVASLRSRLRSLNAHPYPWDLTDPPGELQAIHKDNGGACEDWHTF